MRSMGFMHVSSICLLPLTHASPRSSPAPVVAAPTAAAASAAAAAAAASRRRYKAVVVAAAGAPDFEPPVGRREKRSPASPGGGRGRGRGREDGARGRGRSGSSGRGLGAGRGSGKPSCGGAPQQAASRSRHRDSSSSSSSSTNSTSSTSSSSQGATATAGREQRLAKVLAAAGVASRRACEALIAEGKVAVNGQVVDVQGFRVVPGLDRVTVSGREVNTAGLARGSGGGGGGAGRLYYFAVNKPPGLICSNVSATEGTRVVDLFDGWLAAWAAAQPDKSLLPPRLFTAGRLDVATSGLVFVTNDGAWAQELIHPSGGLTKEYLALVAAPAIPPAKLAALRAGAVVEGRLCVPVSVEVLPPNAARGMPGATSSGRSADDGSGSGGGGGGGSGNSNTVLLRIVVAEGRKREVRTMVDAAGLRLRALHRTRVGGYALPRDLPVGRFAELTAPQAKGVLREVARQGGSRG